MKNLITILIFILFTQNANALYYRFWRGVKKSNLEYLEFYNALNNKFIPVTVNIGKKYGLVSYMPIIKKFNCGKNCKIDEFALVVYKSEKNYLDYKATPEGINYQNMHFDFFEKEKSKSLVPASLEQLKKDNDVLPEHAYEVISSSEIWQNKKVYFIITKKNKSSLNEIFNVKASGYLALADENYIYHYVLEPKIQMEKILNRIQFQVELKNTEPTNLTLKSGEGINTSFNCF